MQYLQRSKAARARSEKVLERIRELVNIDSMQFGFMPGRGATDALFVVRRMQEEYRDKKKKLYVCFVDIEKAFDRVSRKVMKKERFTRSNCKSGDESPSRGKNESSSGI